VNAPYPSFATERSSWVTSAAAQRYLLAGRGDPKKLQWDEFQNCLLYHEVEFLGITVRGEA